MGAVIVVVLLIAGGYGVSLAVHPFRACRTCHGTGRHTGTMFSRAYRDCLSCGGQGRHRRLGTVMFFGGRATWAERSTGQARDTRRSRPR